MSRGSGLTPKSPAFFSAKSSALTMSDPFHRVMQFKAHLRLEVLNGERAFILGEHEQFMLSGRVQVLVAAKLDGQRSVQDVISALEGEVSAPEVLYTVAQLEKQGHLTEATPGIPGETAAFWQALGVAPAEAVSRLARSPVSVHALEGLDPQPLLEALRGAGLTVREGAPLHVVLVRDYLSPELEAFNRRALERREPWMLVKPSGATPWMGPMFRPGAGAVLGVPRGAPAGQSAGGDVRRAAPGRKALDRRALARMVPASARAALDLGALTVARWIVEGGRGWWMSSSWRSISGGCGLEEHAVQRRPQCPVCGDPASLKKRAEQPIVLEPRPKRFTEDGGYRCVTPEETYARYEHLVSPVTGVVNSMARCPARSSVAARSTGPGSSSARRRIGRRHSTSSAGRVWGRGARSRSPGRARSAKRSSAIAPPCRGTSRGSVRACQRSEAAAVHPREVLHFSEAQYRRREQLNAGIQDRRRTIPLPFDDSVAIEWAPVWSLTTGERRYIPAAYCYLGVPAPPEERFCDFDSNGHAAGNCLEEAILQAFFELAERDAVWIWWYNWVRRSAVDLPSFEEPYFQALREHYHSHHWKVWALDLTHDLNIPTFVAVGRSTRTQQYCIGFGAHLDARIALQRAITEFNQISIRETPSSPRGTKSEWWMRLFSTRTRQCRSRRWRTSPSRPWRTSGTTCASAWRAWPAWAWRRWCWT